MSKSVSPKIRFNRCTDAWGQRKLYEVAEFNPKSELPEVFEYVDLESVVGTEMVSYRTEMRETAPSRAQRLAQTGDVFFQTVRPYQRNNYLFVKPDNNYVFSTGYTQMRPKIDADFLMCFLQTDSFVKVVLDNCTGTSYPAINSNDLSNLEIALPVSEDEQKRIGSFITSFDNLITLHQRKLEKMKTVKKSLLEKMFPRNGSNIPEIRFSGYAGGWKQQKMGDMTGFITGKPFSNELAIDGKYIVMDMGSVSQEGKRIEYKKTNEARDMLQENDLVMPKDDIGGGLIIGRTAYIPSNNHYVLGDHVYRLRFNDVNGRFIHYQINSDYIREQIMPLVTGSAQLGLSSKNINDICLNIPSIDEQNKIVYLLDTVDNLIDFYQFKLEKLKDIKKAFLDKMFVKVEV